MDFIIIFFFAYLFWANLSVRFEGDRANAANSSAPRDFSSETRLDATVISFSRDRGAVARSNNNEMHVTSHEYGDDKQHRGLEGPPDQSDLPYKRTRRNKLNDKI